VSWRSRIAGVGIAIAVAGVALSCSDDEGAAPLPPVTALPQDSGVDGGNGFLATTNRTNLGVCVDGTPGYAVNQRDLDAVAEALAESADRLDDGYDDTTVRQVRDGRVVHGCPPPSVGVGKVLGPEALDEALHGEATRSTDAASPHLVFVYFVDRGSFAATFGDEPYIEGTAEMLCEGHVCAGVTTTLYVPDSVSAYDLQLGITDAIGLIGSPDTSGNAPD